ncbi:MAG TPA: hypothetical protein EYG18_00685 [Micavibrio sp.]|jgi:hypothetical protein|nr:hypothetical protein [Micavibrio sp.]HIL27763.1 hypothetical protein [Micavibrio sp.]
MSIDCPAHSPDYEDNQTVEVAVNVEENFLQALEAGEFDTLASLMRAEPEAALAFYDTLTAHHDNLASDLTPHFTKASHFTLEDKDIISRLELAAIGPRTMRRVDEAIEAALADMNRKFDEMQGKKSQTLPVMK